jgi:hypothetical protein
MSEASRRKRDASPAAQPRGAEAWRARAVGQLAACLVAQGKAAALAPLLERHAGSAAEPYVRFYLALLCAQERKLDEAVEHLRRMLEGPIEDARLRRLAFRIFLRFAQRKLKGEEWQAASQALGEAVVNCPQEPRAQHELESLRGALPLAHVQSGNRAAAARVLLEDLRKRPEDCTVLHHLALVHFWWAMELENNPGAAAASAPAAPDEAAARIRGQYAFREGRFVPVETERDAPAAPPAAHPADAAWEGAVAYWSLLADHPLFWNHWTQVQRGCGCALEEKDIEALKERILDERLTKTLQDFASHYLEQNRAEDAARHERYLTALGLERKSAELWPRALALLDEIGAGAAAQNPLLRLPGGFLFFKQLGLLGEVGACVDALVERCQENPLVPQLLIYFSEAGYGQAAVLIEERKKPDAALELLDRLPEEFGQRPEFVYLQARALLEKGHQTAVKKGLLEALPVWKRAWTPLQQFLRKGGLSPAFKQLLQSARDAVAEAVFKACERESGKLKQQDKFDEAIGVLQAGFEVTHRKEVQELLCILYCDRGDRKQNENKFEEARKDFQAALEADSQNSRAKKSLGWTYLNQAAEIGTDNLSKALDLMEQGMKHLGDDPKACGLMAQVCNLRAVELLDNLSSSTPLSRFDEAIRLLRRAIKLKNPEIEDSVLDVIVNEEAVEAIEERTKDFRDETYKKALQNLAYVGRFRRQKRAGDLNSEAVNILNSLAYTSNGGRHSVGRAIEMLEEAARILNPRIGAMLFMIEHMDERQIRNIGGPAATILVNLSTAYKMRRQLGSYY